MSTRTPAHRPASAPPVVRTRAGEVRGAWRTVAGGGEGQFAASAAFLGIPYAKAPVGDLRFAAPSPAEPWDGVRDATRPGPTAQIAPLAAVTTIPEPSVPGDDILNLNVFTPAPGDTAARLPVLVWIHGGGFMGGSQSSPWYDGAAFNRDGVVTVSLGYRLGIEGWLRIAGAPDNRGALDWVAALTWVRDNIAAFGGDPDRVTVAGQSAGGGAALTLLGMPGAAGLLHRAAPISGAVGDARTVADAEDLARRFTLVTGLPATVEGLRGLSRAQLHDAALAATAPTGDGSLLELSLAPYPDGATIPATVQRATANGAGADVPLLLGCTRHELDLAGTDADPGLPRERVVDALVRFGMPRARAAEQVASWAGTVGELVGRVLTEGFFTSLTVAVAEARAASDGAGTWLYEFAWESRAPSTAGQAYHCVDLPFWWDCLSADAVEEATGPNPPQPLADAMHEALVRFVGSGAPGWQPYRAPDRPVMVWGDESRVVGDAFGGARRRWPMSRLGVATAQGPGRR